MTARSENPGFYLKMNNKWWESYDGEKNVIIEDVGHSHEWMGDFLKIWADRYGFRGEIKSDSTVLRPDKIIVTSNYHPKDLWPDPNIHEPIMRRFKFRNFITLKKMDDTTQAPKRQKLSHSLFTPKQPPLLRQNAQGNLEPYKDTQSQMDEFLETVPKVSWQDPRYEEICDEEEFGSDLEKSSDFVDTLGYDSEGEAAECSDSQPVCIDLTDC